MPPCRDCERIAAHKPAATYTSSGSLDVRRKVNVNGVIPRARFGIGHDGTNFLRGLTAAVRCSRIPEILFDNLATYAGTCMPTLRLTQSSVSPDRFRVEAALEGDETPRQVATSEFDFRLSDQDREDLRWYLEDYLQHAADPAPRIAARIERRIAEIGDALFKAAFESSKTAERLWARLQPGLNGTRIEIVAGVREATAIPWELLRDPLTETPLALEASSFVRAQTDTARPVKPVRRPEDGDDRIRILLVICRPRGGADVPFRSVASRLIKGLGESARQAFQLDVLRPPTFAQLGRALRAARSEGKPYHVVHFDGHGAYEEIGDPDGLAALRRELSAIVLSAPRVGAQGYLLFENPDVEENLQLVDGLALGQLLTETDVPVLVLNACRSAHAEAPAEPDEVRASPAARYDVPSQGVHAQVRAFGSLAQEVVDAGVAGVVAMRYNVYVVTAAQFVADLYQSLAEGRTLGEAVSLGRKQLHEAPLREIAWEPRRLQDWMVPIVYEAAPIHLFPASVPNAALRITVRADAAAPSIGALASEVERRPDAGFFGRDETLLALDRAFDRQQIVLLHGYAGSGKTSTAAEFARWYRLTGGIAGPVLFTSFEQRKTLPDVLNGTIGRLFGDALEQSGIHWLTLTDEERREVALTVMAHVPVLWIWDNVEPIAGFPADRQSVWTDLEQKDLAEFLRAAARTKAKFLLTSRREEREWLGDDLPMQVAVPSMPMQERVQLARALAERHKRRLVRVGDWIPLLDFTRGNPLTITVLVGQALRDGLETRAQIEAFVERLRSGAAAFDDEVAEGRERSLGASLRYGFTNAFTEAERRQLALLHFFQGFVDVEALRVMGHPEAEWCVPEVRGMSNEAAIALLDRAAEIGLLTAYGNGYYSIHPALPWFFRSLFEECYAVSTSTGELRSRAARAFTEAIGRLGGFYAEQSFAGTGKPIVGLTFEEANLLHARQLARTHGWWSSVVGAMQGLRTLYYHTGRRAEWARLVGEIVPDFVDPATDGPVPGLEDSWSIFTGYRVDLARDARQWDTAERLLRSCVDWDRRRAAPTLGVPANALSAMQRKAIQSLTATLNDLAYIQLAAKKGECVDAYAEAMRLAELLGDRANAAACALSMGHACIDIPSIRDFNEAERWYRRAMDLAGATDLLTRSQCLSALGMIAYGRFDDGRSAHQPESEIVHHLRSAFALCDEGLRLLPPTEVAHLANAHSYLGFVHSAARDSEKALYHWRESIGHSEAQGDTFRAGMSRFNIARCLTNERRLADAREYAQAAARDLRGCGVSATDQLREVEQLIDVIERLGLR
jgi:tetratricopeptide (TPR) repeat protein